MTEMNPETDHTEEIRIAKPEKKNNNVLIGINLVLIILVAVMIFLHFSSKPEKETNNLPDLPTKIAYIDSDTLKANYILAQQMREKLETKYSEMEAELTQKETSLQNRYYDLQRKVQSNAMTIEEAQVVDQKLMQEQQALLTLKDQYSTQLAIEEMQLNEVFLDSIDSYLRRYNQNVTYDYILGYTRGGGILFANDSLDITLEVLEGLNMEYEENPTFEEAEKAEETE